jgi:hypothetical protein
VWSKRKKNTWQNVKNTWQVATSKKIHGNRRKIINCNKKMLLFFKETIKTLPKRGFEVGTL